MAHLLPCPDGAFFMSTHSLDSNLAPAPHVDENILCSKGSGMFFLSFLFGLFFFSSPASSTFLAQLLAVTIGLFSLFWAPKLQINLQLSRNRQAGQKEDRPTQVLHFTHLWSQEFLHNLAAKGYGFMLGKRSDRQIKKKKKSLESHRCQECNQAFQLIILRSEFKLNTQL